MSQHGAHGSMHSKITLAGLLITLGIIYGDIGTSPLYVLKAIVGKENPIDAEVVLGGLSCIIWTLTLQTTIKYVFLTLKADNKGEGGIFALYALVKKTKVKWLLFPAMIGGAAVLAEGIITPPISISSAIEGLKMTDTFKHLETNDIVPITIAIISMLFFIQQFGTNFVGKFFGPVMLIWFVMLGVLGVSAIHLQPEVLRAINPYYAYKLLAAHPGGFWILGAVFLCTTGAEALYSDLGHCGRRNIRMSWIFVKAMLVLNYFGQSAWLMSNEGFTLGDRNPFYLLMPEWFLPVGIAIATVATIVASQALITGSFTLINEAIRLNFWPKVKIKYPTELRGQLYIPSINWMLMIGCIGVVLYFRESEKMEAAYGLTIILGMLMSSRLLTFFMRIKKYPGIFIVAFVLIYLIVELSFFIAQTKKFPEGGWISMLIAALLFLAMFSWHQARKIRNRYVEFTKLNDYLPLMKELSNDVTVPKYSTHLVYLTSADHTDEIEAKIMYSIFQKQPKRADIYWFVHVDVMDEPYKMEYKVTEIIKNDVIRIDFRLGFRVAPRINMMFRNVVQDLVANHEVDIVSRYESLQRQQVIGDFRFIVIEKHMSYDNEFPVLDKIFLDIYGALKYFSISEEAAFGLDTSSVFVEKVPIVISPPKDTAMKRIQ
jgi:KUP system potassium uptake protein